ncbi:MAG: Hypoxanthine-guanine phosphoribosyltransferase [Betaproteobacteria bacterium ADurb.Bin341]|nr:MAG: Hypoxanthine-guanine phosphoribosyltransferase [Betaproteobacteria bacterium ADurb.Bin341]
MEAQEARDILAKSSLVHSPEAVQAALQRVAGEIAATLSDKNPLVLCVMTGGLIFSGQLLPKLDFPLEFDYLHVTRYGQDTQGGKLSWRSAPWTTVKGRTVLVIDDILDEGLTLAAVCESIKRLGAAEVKTAVFVEKENGKQKPIKADFIGLTVPDRFVFGFGMDVSGAWRHLPAIYAMPEG